MENNRALTPSPGPDGQAVLCGVAQPGTIGEAYLDHAVMLRRVAIRKFGVPPSDVDALVHDVFANFLALASRSKPRDIRRYLISAICNASRNYWRSKRSESRVFADDEAAVEDAKSAFDAYEAVTKNLVVASILAKLGLRCREILQRYYLDGEDTSSIAAAIQTTCANVNYLMHSCRKRARAAYEGITRVR